MYRKRYHQAAWHHGNSGVARVMVASWHGMTAAWQCLGIKRVSLVSAAWHLAA